MVSVVQTETIQVYQQVLTSGDICSYVFGFLEPGPLAVCNLVCLAWANKHAAVKAKYFTTSLSLLKYARYNGCKWDEWTCGAAAMNGHLDCLQYLHNNKCPWYKNICDHAANAGHLDCLRYALEI